MAAHRRPETAARALNGAPPLTDRADARLGAINSVPPLMVRSNPEPGAINSVPPFMGGTDARTPAGQAGRTAAPPLIRVIPQGGTRMGQTGLTTAPAGQRLVSLRQSWQGGAFHASGQQAADRRNTASDHSRAPLEETGPERGAVPLTKLRPQGKETPGSTSVRRKEALTAPAEARAQAEAPQKRPGREAKAPRKGERAAENRPSETARPGTEKETSRGAEPITAPQTNHRRSTAAGEQGADRPPSPARDGTGRVAEAPAGTQAEAVYAQSGRAADGLRIPSEAGGTRNPEALPTEGAATVSPEAVRLERQLSGSYGAWIRSTAGNGPNGGGVWEYSVLSAPYPVAAGGRDSLFPIAQTGWFPIGLRLGAGWKTETVFPFFQPRNGSAAGQAAGGRAAANGFALQWRRNASGLEPGNVPAAGTTPNKALPAGVRASRTAVPTSGAAGHTHSTDIRTIAARSMAWGGAETVFPAGTEAARFVLQTQPGREIGAAVRRVLEAGQPNTFPALQAVRFSKSAGAPKQGEPRQPSAPTGNGRPAASGPPMPIPTRAMEPFFLKRLKPPLPAGTAASPVRASAPEPRTAGRTIYGTRTGPVRRTLADFPREGTAVQAGHAGQAQWAEGRMPHQGLAVPGPAGAEQYERIRSLTALRVLPGTEGDVFLRWLSPSHAAGTAPAGQGGRVTDGRIAGFAEEGGLSERRTPGGTAPAKIFRTPDGHASPGVRSGPENRGVFPTAFRSAPGFGRRGAPPQGQPAAAAAWGAGPVKYPASVRFVPRVLRGAHTQTGGRLLLLQNTRPGAGEDASRPEGSLTRVGTELLRGRTYLSRTGVGTALTDNGPRPMGTVRLWSAPRPAGTGAVQLKDILHPVGTEAVRPGYIPHAARTGTVQLGYIPHAMKVGAAQPGYIQRPVGTGAVQPGNIPHPIGTGAVQPGNLPHPVGARTVRTGNIPHPVGAGTVQMGNIPHAVGTRAVQPGNILHSVGTGAVQPWNSPRPVGTGAVQPGTPPHSVGMDMVRPGNILRRAGASVIRTGRGWFRTGTAAQAGKPPAGVEGHSALPGLTHFAQPMEPLEKTLPGAPSAGTGADSSGEGRPAMIFRTPAPPEARTAPAPEQEGESVLAAQTIAPEQARAVSRAFSYTSPASAGSTEPPPEVPAEQRSQTTGLAAEDINYNRLTEELLVRIERRLRAERRKFGL